jgi:2-polyprenyl-6-methoxyphenol hydroxylase-like FAD-dependent oxidoreductase
LPSTLDALVSPPLRRVAMMRRNQCATAPLPAAADPQHAWGRAVGRETLDTLLLAKAHDAGALVLQPWSVLSVDGKPGDMRAATLNISTGEKAELQARMVILANGSWEPIQSARKADRRIRRDSDLLAFKANFVGANLDAGALPILAFAGGYGGMVIADRGTATIACCIRAGRLAALRSKNPGRSAGYVVEAMLRRECAGVNTALRPATRSGPWLGSGPIDPGIRLRDDEPYFRIGNAAGEAHPIIGEGMSMAMQSAWLLCDRLLTTSSSGHLENTSRWHAEVARLYAVDWRRNFAARLRIAAVFAHIAMRPLPAYLLVTVAHFFPGVVTLGARWCAKVRCAISPATIARLESEQSFSSLPANVQIAVGSTRPLIDTS